MRRWNAPSNRPAASWCDPKSAVCTTATNGKPPDRACCTGHATVAGRRSPPAHSVPRISITEFDRLRLATAYSGGRTSPLGEPIELEIASREAVANHRPQSARFLAPDRVLYQARRRRTPRIRRSLSCSGPDADPVRKNCLTKSLNVFESLDVASLAEMKFGDRNWPEIIKHDSADQHHNSSKRLAPQAGFEPAALRLTAAAALPRGRWTQKPRCHVAP